VSRPRVILKYLYLLPQPLFWKLLLVGAARELQYNIAEFVDVTIFTIGVISTFAPGATRFLRIGLQVGNQP
jgi:hypothetical protein